MVYGMGVFKMMWEIIITLILITAVLINMKILERRNYKLTKPLAIISITMAITIWGWVWYL